MSSILLGLSIIFIGSKLGAWCATKLKQPAVLGELLFGIVLGNLTLLHIDFVNFLHSDEIFKVFAELGAILLLFEVGLETNIHELAKVGVSASLVAIVGVVAPMLLGFYFGETFLQGSSTFSHLFLGAVLCATSVGITARVLRDLGKTQTTEARIILGAAVIDDVLGLLILAILSGSVAAYQNTNTAMSAGLPLEIILGTAAKSVGVLVLSLFLGLKIAPYVYRWGARIKIEGIMQALALATCFIFATTAQLVGLAPIVGAFAAGLIVDSSGLDRMFDHEKNALEDLLLPISQFFVPIFFVTMGMHVELKYFTNLSTIALALGLTFVAIFGKQICGLVVFDKKVNRTAIGIGMIPRGEVGLIFASMGAQLKIDDKPIIDAQLFSAVVIMVALTTIITPATLSWALKRKTTRRS